MNDPDLHSFRKDLGHPGIYTEKSDDSSRTCITLIFSDLHDQHLMVPLLPNLFFPGLRGYVDFLEEDSLPCNGRSLNDFAGGFETSRGGEVPSVALSGFPLGRIIEDGLVLLMKSIERTKKADNH